MIASNPALLIHGLVRDAQSEHEMIVFKRVGVMIEAVRYHDRTLFQIDALNVAREKVDMTMHLSDGIHHVCHIEIARGDFMEFVHKLLVRCG